MLRTDLKIFKSQRMTQNPNAGGQRTTNEVANGQLNEVFGNISAIDHAQSAVDIVKIYPGVSTANTQLLQDAHVLINEPPEDPKVDVMLIEAPGVTDASVRSNIVEAIESGVTAGLLLRSGLSAMLAGQNSISSADLLNNQLPGEQRDVYIGDGQIIAISVEYPGNENSQWPRFVHYAKVVGGTAYEYRDRWTSVERQQGNIIFEPPLPFNTPGPNVTINTQDRCTRLRATNANNNVNYHGVTRLTAEADQAGILSVQKTIGRLLPRLTSLVDHPVNLPFVTDLNLVLKQAKYPAAGSVYNLPISDLADLSGSSVRNYISVSYITANLGGAEQIVPFSDYKNGVLSFVLNFTPLAGSEISVFYYSSDRYERYVNTDPWPSDRALIPSTIFGTVMSPVGSTQRVSVYTSQTADANQIFANSPVNGQRELVAEVNIITGVFTYFNGYSDIVYSAVLVNPNATSPTLSTAEFNIPYAEIQTDSLYITAELATGGLISASADSGGIISGVGVNGSINNGAVNLVFTDAVLATSINYSVSEIVALTPPASLYSLNQLRIANGSAVPMFREFGVVSITHNQYSDVSELNPGTTLNQRPGAFIDIVDSTGASLWHPLDAHYSYNKTTGVVTVVDASAFTGPFEVTDTIGELALVAQVNGNQLVLTTPLQGTYPAGAVVSSVQVLGNLQAAANVLFDMTTWNNIWSDTSTGSPAVGNFNELNYPIEVENRSAINERWVIVFTSPTAFNCIGQGLGLIASGDTLNDFAPINPNTLQPYFVIRSQGWGGGWNAGECVRFNTEAAAKPLVMLRSVSAGHSQIEQDSIRLHFRGNAD
ncbi:MAG: hypothetical protein PHE38_11040 [Alishewanella agri]|nr:hypothetical protein [Alishewanella agri]